MEDCSATVKKENPVSVEIFDEEIPIIKQEKDTPEYVNIHLFSNISIKSEGQAEIDHNTSVEQIYQCTYCHLKYKKFEYLTIHLAMHNPDMSCTICSEIFTCRRKFKIHVNNHIRTKLSDDRKVSHACLYCSKTFSTKKQLTIHTRVHTNERPYKCEICAEAFKQLGALKAHHVTHTKERNFTCEICNGAYTTSSSLKRHKRKIHDRGKTIDCRHCNEKFLNKADYNAHQTVHPVNEFEKTCPTCALVFFKPYMYRKHRKHYSEHFPKSSRGKIRSCRLCGIDIAGKALYFEHVKQHIDYTDSELKEAIKSKTFPCKSCPAVYRTKQNIFQHMDKHLEKTLKCSLCQNYVTHFSLKAHNRRVHNIVECAKCREVFMGRSKLYRHYIKNHNKFIKVYPCNMCGKKFFVKKILIIHRRMKHKRNGADFKRTICTICNLRFGRQSSVMTHKKRVHNFKVRLKCSLCELSFETIKEIDSHSLMHKETASKRDDLRDVKRTKKKKKIQKFYRCKVCMKIFKSLEHYKTHMSHKVCLAIIAQKRKLSYCQFCGKGFLGVHRLKRHLQLHSNFDYECQECNHKTKMVESMRRHMKTRHPDKEIFWCDSCGNSFDTLTEFKAHNERIQCDM